MQGQRRLEPSGKNHLATPTRPPNLLPTLLPHATPPIVFEPTLRAWLTQHVCSQDVRRSLHSRAFAKPAGGGKRVLEETGAGGGGREGGEWGGRSGREGGAWSAALPLLTTAVRSAVVSGPYCAMVSGRSGPVRSSAGRRTLPRGNGDLLTLNPDVYLNPNPKP